MWEGMLELNYEEFGTLRVFAIEKRCLLVK